ncbi:SGNH/GDSL hydrolase family protein [Pelagibacterium montanilacus]|uniref:SGNH/GDSL hydrolase family protein n=1 Tax=Pelagibacterium montanilacus TaxID=2185280 RepID=UPI000F8E0CCA|nr:SGNH/GDSL hydrolase family protein [Pelagibacterium montanilacus]
MKTILAFGDSLTFGSDAESGGRHRFEDRWPTRLEAGLAGSARVIAEGLGGRTTAFDDWSAAGDRNGVRLLPTLLNSHKPLDLVVIMLGTNDLKTHLCGTAHGASQGMKRLVEIVRTHPYGEDMPVPQVMIVAPPHAVQTDEPDFTAMFGERIAESHRFAEHYARVAEQTGAAFFDAATIATATPLDGVHLDAANTRAIGDALAPLVSRILGL